MHLTVLISTSIVCSGGRGGNYHILGTTEQEAKIDEITRLWRGGGSVVRCDSVFSLWKTLSFSQLRNHAETIFHAWIYQWLPAYLRIISQNKSMNDAVHVWEDSRYVQAYFPSIFKDRLQTFSFSVYVISPAWWNQEWRWLIRSKLRSKTRPEHNRKWHHYPLLLQRTPAQTHYRYVWTQPDTAANYFYQREEPSITAH